MDKVWVWPAFRFTCLACQTVNWLPSKDKHLFDLPRSVTCEKCHAVFSVNGMQDDNGIYPIVGAP